MGTNPLPTESEDDIHIAIQENEADQTSFLERSGRNVSESISPIQSGDSGSLPEMRDTIIFEFAVSGMTCVACSGSIERLMHNEFDNLKMVSVSIVLLTNKMFATFEAQVF